MIQKAFIVAIFLFISLHLSAQYIEVGPFSGAIYQAFTASNTRFVMTDLRSMRDKNDKPDNARKSMMGNEQLSWFKNEM